MIDRGLFSADEIAIFEKYDYRCIHCKKAAVTLHEITPKSSLPRGQWKREGNRIPICAECHTWAHTVGIKISRPILIQCQEEFGSGNAWE